MEVIEFMEFKNLHKLIKTEKLTNKEFNNILIERINHIEEYDEFEIIKNTMTIEKGFFDSKSNHLS